MTIGKRKAGCSAWTGTSACRCQRTGEERQSSRCNPVNHRLARFNAPAKSPQRNLHCVCPSPTRRTSYPSATRLTRHTIVPSLSSRVTANRRMRLAFRGLQRSDLSVGRSREPPRSHPSLTRLFIEQPACRRKLLDQPDASAGGGSNWGEMSGAGRNSGPIAILLVAGSLESRLTTRVPFSDHDNVRRRK